MKNTISDTSIHFDNIISNIQSHGGISTFWHEVTSRVSEKESFNTVCSSGSKLFRYFPILSRHKIFHSSYFRTPFFFQHHVKTVVTVHDLIYEELLAEYIKSLDNIFGFPVARINRKSINIISVIVNCWHRKKAIKRANAVVCVSNTTKQKLLDFYPELKSKEKDIYVIYNGVSFTKEQLADIMCPSKLLEELYAEVNSHYVLFVGGRHSYKNFDLALIGFSRSKQCVDKNCYFICTGKGFNSEEESLINSLNLNQRVKVVPNATTEELVFLYKKAYALLYISSNEGFGIPTIEAMSCRCPVITSTCPAVAEVVGNASITIDVEDTSSISNAIDLLEEESARKTYVELGESRMVNFSWEIAASKYMKIYKSLS